MWLVKSATEVELHLFMTLCLSPFQCSLLMFSFNPLSVSFLEKREETTDWVQWTFSTSLTSCEAFHLVAVIQYHAVHDCLASYVCMCVRLLLHCYKFSLSFSVSLSQAEFTQNLKIFKVCLHHHHAYCIWSFCRCWQLHHTGRHTNHLEDHVAQRTPAKIDGPIVWPKQPCVRGSASLAAWITGSSSCQQWWR